MRSCASENVADLFRDLADTDDLGVFEFIPFPILPSVLLHLDLEKVLRNLIPSDDRH